MLSRNILANLVRSVHHIRASIGFQFNRTSSTQPPIQEHDMGSHGKATLRKMEKRDFPDVCRFLMDRQSVIDFGESDISFMLEDTNHGGAGILAETEQDGIISFIMAVKYHDNGMSGICYRHVDQQFRGTGLGAATAYYAIKHLDTGRLVGYKYPDSDYTYYGYSGSQDSEFNVWDGSFRKMPILHDHYGFELTELGSVSLDALVDYDAGIHKIPRPVILTAISLHPRTSGFVAVRNGNIIGYSLVRHCFANRFKIAPLFADSEDVALALLEKSRQLMSCDDHVTITTCSNHVFMEDFLMRREFTKIPTSLVSVMSVDGSQPILSREDYRKVFGLTNLSYSIC